MNDNTKQNTCPVRGLTPAGRALVQKLKEEHSLFINFQTKNNGNAVFINVSVPFK